VSRASKASAQKFLNDLLHGLYDRTFLATHSLKGGKSSSKGFITKPAVPPEQIKDIIGNYFNLNKFDARCRVAGLFGAFLSLLIV